MEFGKLLYKLLFIAAGIFLIYYSEQEKEDLGKQVLWFRIAGVVLISWAVYAAMKSMAQ